MSGGGLVGPGGGGKVGGGLVGRGGGGKVGGGLVGGGVRAGGVGWNGRGVSRVVGVVVAVGRDGVAPGSSVQ